MPRIARRRLIGTAIAIPLIVSILIAGLITIGINDTLTTTGMDDYKVYSGNFTDDHCLNTTLLAIVIEGTYVDIVAQAMKIRCNFKLCGNLINPNPTQFAYPEASTPINITIGPQTFIFQQNQLMLTQAGSTFLSGDYNHYPLDSFSVGFTIQGTFGWNRTAIPLHVEMRGIPNGFLLDYKIQTIQPTQIAVTSKVTRNYTVISFAFMVSISMWILAIFACVLASFLWIFDKKVEPAYIAMTISLLFAMPGVRNSMPSAPPIGCLLDEMCLVWVMMLLAACVASHFVKLLITIYPSDGTRKLSDSDKGTGTNNANNDVKIQKTEIIMFE
ncbi:hypothetical protein BDR26DRAFT_919107 [Obelidium mucronatum]|nr:hypothetical protein BDR26DRAFT_919107 [Obelidium mucronatum]